jgi:hypothetical protein
MNTSTNINQIHATTTSTARTGFLRRTMAGTLLIMALAATGIGFASASYAHGGAPTPDFAGGAHADSTCQTEPFGFLGSQRRTLCDGPITSDGSWSRERTIWLPAQYSTPSCISSGRGGYSSRASCLGGYLIPERMISNETYPVRPDTVLPDEPGHLN